MSALPFGPLSDRGSAAKVLVLVVASACAEPELRPRPPSDGAPHFTVMSYNIELGAQDEASTLDSIGRIGADIVCLQEVTPAAEAALRTIYAEEYPYQLFQARGGAGGLAVLSHFPLTDGGLRLAPEGWHPAWHIEVDTAGGPLQLLNVHLRSLFSADSGPVDSFLSAEEDHLREIRDFVAGCDEDEPTIVLGDFNEGIDGRAVRFLEESGFLNVLPAFRPGQPTWYFPSVGDQLEETIDHILIDDSLVPLNAWVERRGRSDHLPVVAHVEPREF